MDVRKALSADGGRIGPLSCQLLHGVTRWTAWLIWAHVVNSFEFDLSWGGPGWVPALVLAPLQALGPSVGTLYHFSVG